MTQEAITVFVVELSCLGNHFKIIFTIPQMVYDSDVRYIPKMTVYLLIT